MERAREAAVNARGLRQMGDFFAGEVDAPGGGAEGPSPFSFMKRDALFNLH
jgi:hypothetical protein